MNRLSDLWTNEGLLLGSGAMGTELQSLGLPLGEPPERWNRERSRAVAQVHAAYAAAGARWLVANTFGGSRPRLAAFGLDAQTAEINAAAVVAARVAETGLPVLASLGPTGAPGPWAAVYEEQVALLAEAEVDGWLVETVVALPEGLAAVRAAAAAGVGPVIASFTPGPAGDLPDGTPLEEAADAFAAAGAAAVGVNCGAGPEGLLEPARRLVRASVAPVYAAPSAGLPTMEGGRPSYPMRSDSFACHAIQFEDLGVRLFAGCCGTTPAHLRAASVRLVRQS